jgi:alkylated DNA repair dioxygenase AlkB
MISIKHTNDKPTIFFYQDNVFTDDELIFLRNLNYIDGTHNDKQISRKQLWFQEDNKYFCPLWNKRLSRWVSNEYFENLKEIQNKIQKYIEKLDRETSFFKENEIVVPRINSCLINYYETGNDFIPPHKDTPISFGEYPTIVCISYGETRDMVLKNNDEKYKFNLKSNSLFIMAGTSQKYYTHEILKSDTKNARYSMTFREYLL